MEVLTRQDVARKLGRRVSRGQFERMFAGWVRKTCRVTSVSRGRREGALRVTVVRHPDSPKARRKDDALHGGTGKRARYT